MAIALALFAWAIQAIEPAGAELRPDAVLPPFALPFARDAAWVVVAPAAGRLPDRARAWAVSFRPVAGSMADADDAVLAPVAGRVRLLDVRPPIAPVWCQSGGAWSGPQREVVIDTDDVWSVVLGALDDLEVEGGQRVMAGHPLGRLSHSSCAGERALELILWHSGENGIRGHPFGNLGGYRDDELVPGRRVVGS
jgi:hypothetical protein